MIDEVLFILHGIGAVVVLRLLWRSILPATEPLRADLCDAGRDLVDVRATVYDVWLPLALIGPTAAAAAHSLDTSSGWSVAPLGAAATVCWIGAGLVCMLWGRRGSVAATGVTTPLLMLLLTGFVLILLAAANVLTVATGQTMFAAAMVLIWLNTPELSRETDGSAAASAPPALLGAVAIALVQGLLVHRLHRTPLLDFALAASVIEAVVALVVVASVSVSACLRIAAWIGVYGVLLGVGLMSLTRLSGIVARLGAPDLNPEGPIVSFGAASGFARAAIEGSMLSSAAVAMMYASRLPPRLRVALGAALCIAGASFAAVRLRA